VYWERMEIFNTTAGKQAQFVIEAGFRSSGEASDPSGLLGWPRPQHIIANRSYVHRI
jgi:hypothetical protein